MHRRTNGLFTFLTLALHFVRLQHASTPSKGALCGLALVAQPRCSQQVLVKQYFHLETR